MLSWVLVTAAPSTPCSRECVHQNCGDFNIRYGNYCGVGHTGCDGVKPCDAYDKCCEAHDNCVGKSSRSVMDTGCHGVLSACLRHALNNGTKTFLIEREERTEEAQGGAAECTASKIVQTMSNGMQMASVFSTFLGGLGGGKMHGAAATPGAASSRAATPGFLPMTRPPLGAEHAHHESFEERRAAFAARKAKHDQMMREMEESFKRNKRRRLLHGRYGRSNEEVSVETISNTAAEAAAAPSADLSDEKHFPRELSGH